MLKILFKLILQLTKYIPIHLSFMNSIYTTMKKKKNNSKFKIFEYGNYMEIVFPFQSLNVLLFFNTRFLKINFLK